MNYRNTKFHQRGTHKKAGKLNKQGWQQRSMFIRVLNPHQSATLGFTLVELLVSIAILAIVSLVTVTIYVTGLKNTQIEAQKANLQSDNKTVLEKIAADTRDATAVVSTKDTYTSSSTTLILSVPAIDSSQEIIYSGENFVLDYIIYTLSGGVLQKIVIANISSSRESIGPVNILGNCTINFNYTPDLATASEVEITLTNQATAGKKLLTSTNTTKSKLRNK